MEKLIALKHKLDAIKTMGTNAKKEALANLDEFEQSMVSLMLNPFIRFGVKKYKVAKPLETSVPSDQKVVELLEKPASVSACAIRCSKTQFRSLRYSWPLRTRRKATNTHSNQTPKSGGQ